jgi:hypothetical protein
MISLGAQPILNKGKIMSSVWRSILFFIVLILVISAMGLVFFPGH